MVAQRLAELLERLIMFWQREASEERSRFLGVNMFESGAVEQTFANGGVLGGIANKPLVEWLFQLKRRGAGWR